MKARRIGTKKFREIGTVTFKDSFSVFSAELLEFEQEPDNTPDHWQDVRERAAIAAIQAFCSAPVSKDTSITIDDATKFAVEIADALVEKLKGE